MGGPSAAAMVSFCALHQLHVRAQQIIHQILDVNLLPFRQLAEKITTSGSR